MKTRIQTFSAGLIAIVTSYALIFGGAVTADDPQPITYTEHILPIFRAECLSCHNEDDPQGELDLSRYQRLMEGGVSGAVVDPGDPSSSRLYRLITHADQPSMPPETPMIAKEWIDLIRVWIEAGSAESGETAIAKQRPADVDLRLLAPQIHSTGQGPLPPRLSQQTVKYTEIPSAVHALATSPAAPLLAMTGNRQVLLFRTDTLTPLGRLVFPEGIIKVLTFSRDGSLLLAAGGLGGQSGAVVVWQVATGERVFSLDDELDSVFAADISSDHRRLALGGSSGVVKLYDFPAGELIKKIEEHTDWILSVRFSDDGVLLASADRHGGILLSEAWTGDEYLPLRGHKSSVTALAWGEDSNQLAAGDGEGFIRIWEVDKGGVAKKLKAHAGGVMGLDAAGSGRWLSAGRDGLTRLWDATGKPIRTFPALSDLATATSWCATTGRVITGGYGGETVVWQPNDGKRLGRLNNNPPMIRVVMEKRQRDVDDLLEAVSEAERHRETLRIDVAAAQRRATATDSAYRAAENTKAKNRTVLLAERRVARDLEIRIAEIDQILAVTRNGSRGDNNDKRANTTAAELRKQRSVDLVRRKLTRSRIAALEGRIAAMDRQINELGADRTATANQLQKIRKKLEVAEKSFSAYQEQQRVAVREIARLIDEASFAAAIESLGRLETALIARRETQAQAVTESASAQQDEVIPSETMEAEIQAVRKKIRQVRGL
jgi:WD40 repeat protein